MKSVKRILALLLVLVMTAAMTTTAFAAGSGSIAVNGTTSGKTYDIYKIFDLTYSGDNVAYTIDPDWVNFFIGTSAPGKDYLLTAQPSGGSLNQLTYNGATYYINITDSNVAAFAQKALAWCADNTPAADKSLKASGTTLTFSGLDLGYYLVYPQGAADIKSGYGSICSLTSTKPAGNVNVKAEYPTIIKKADKEGVEIGEVVTYTATGKVPDTTGYTTYVYELKDTMSKGLTFNTTVDNITVKFGSTTIAVEGSGVAAGTTYTVANNGFDLKFDMTKYQSYKGQAITITYQAVVNADAVAQVTENKLTLDYSHDPQNPTDTTTTPPQDVPVYTSEIVINKVDGKDNTKKLANAEFVLVKKSGSTETFYKLTPASGTAAAKVEWVSGIANATVVKTNPSGAAEFEGLKDGIYYLRETKSPAGYNLLVGDVEVKVDHTTTNNKPIGVSVTSKVENNAGTVLPSTGGEGTTMLIAFGAFLFMATMIVLVTKKRMYNEGR